MRRLPPGVRYLQNTDDDDVEHAARQMADGNPDMDLDIARELCEDMQDRGVLEDYLEADPDEDDDDLAALAEFRNPGDIRRIEMDGDGVKYENVMLLAPGAWTDAGSRSTAIYSAEGIRASAENWVDPETGDDVEEAEINFLHGPALHNAASLGDIGTIPTDSIIVDDQDRMYGDIKLHGESPASQASIELMDEVLESADDPGTQTPPVGPSVEIVGEESETDPETGASRLTEMWYSGVGLVFGPASRPVEMEQQARGRAIAMAEDHGYDHTGLILRSGGESGPPGSGETPLNTSRHAGDMGKKQRQRINKLLAEMQQVLQEGGDLELIQTLIEQYRQSEGDMEAPASEFLAWVGENADVDPEEIQDSLEKFVEDAGADDLEEAAVQGLEEWVMENMAEEPEGDGDGDENGDENGDGMGQEELREAVDTIGKFTSELESVKEMLSEYKGDVDETVEELEDEIEEKERRLSKLEDQPVRQAREHQNGEDFYSEDGDSGGSGEHEDVMLT
ncbi:hypothetical protein HALLA_12060 [Halostagnicola larsenii XH-48]|uniref:Uncharacterized protein n=1 Tax=Halostagnicola larsenii XH-48 TaxID=797299 RepID=W0JQT0_9EURY|nr:hypothetical protein [Halostagnicola larsenii]AHG00910.1 hypothetical protein HALLA_11760 [Halostagnicola larsenii XH-48]AHG00959.1 hypothetical protein HALLA_12060 [Halostagnicola larsenii XH-48]